MLANTRYAHARDMLFLLYLCIGLLFLSHPIYISPVCSDDIESFFLLLQPLPIFFDSRSLASPSEQPLLLLCSLAFAFASAAYSTPARVSFFFAQQMVICLRRPMFAPHQDRRTTIV